MYVELDIYQKMDIVLIYLYSRYGNDTLILLGITNLYTFSTFVQLQHKNKIR